MKNTLYQSFWRTHFYAALFITPLLISLTLSGIGYLFYTNVENQLYDKYFLVKVEKPKFKLLMMLLNLQKNHMLAIKQIKL